MSALECRGLSVERGGTRVVHDLDLEVQDGGWLAVVGPNGAGKSSLLLAAAGLVPASGHLRVAGSDPGRLSRRAASRLVALMPQQPVVPPGMSVGELVALGRTPHLGTFATETARDLAAVEDALVRLDLGGFRDRPVETLSGGELQRVMLARALCQEPRVLLLDEPTSALDLGHQQAVLDLVDSLRTERGITVVAAMHDLTLAAQYAERVLLLDGGRKVADGPPADVFDGDRLNRVYAARVDVLDRPSGPAVVPVRRRPR
ncbi:ABC transporter ATP-binding protein [Nocardioides sp. SYSU DS0663]|uniref:ABC transporter ATP-binding protein n=1 Tax=Nocardioides sp. SYSU DS0663 TaxID=3416445 RepID=UPI003F4B43F0